MNRQNQDGSFGGYEKYRAKIGNDAEFRAYLHTTLVCFETFVEFEDRKSVFNQAFFYLLPILIISAKIPEAVTAAPAPAPFIIKGCSKYLLV